MDETNAHAGLVGDLLKAHLPSSAHLFAPFLTQIQRDLFDLGAELSADSELSQKKFASINQDSALRLEREIDRLNEPLEALSSFVLPGGSVYKRQTQYQPIIY